MAPHPGIDAEKIKEKARTDLLDLLEGVPGKKNLVIEQALAGPIDVFVKFSTLQQYGVETVFLLENGNVDDSQRNVVFLTRCENAERPLAIAEQIKKLQQSSSKEHEFTVALVPRRTLVSNKIFEDAGVLGDLVILDLPVYLFPLEPDLLSLELGTGFGDLFLRKDPTSIHVAAQALMLIQKKHGLFPRIMGKGDSAHRLMEILLKMRAEATASEPSNSGLLGLMPSGQIESLIILDREVDFGTPLLTQLTYEGLIDEMFGIKDNKADIDTSIVGAAPGQQSTGANITTTQKGTKRKIILNSSDKLYEQLRDCNFATVGSRLNKIARRLESDYESRHGMKSTAEMRDFVNKLPGYQAEQQSLKIHTGLTEDIMKQTRTDFFSKTLEVQQNLAAGADPAGQHDNIEELIARGAPIKLVLRLLCLESCVSGGIRQKELDAFRTLIMHAYGHQHLLTLDALEKMQLLVVKGSNMPSIPGISSGAAQPTRTNYNFLRKTLHLIVDEVNETDPNDIAFVYSGYAPLSVRLVQCILQKQYLLNFTKSKDQSAANTTGISTAAHGWQGFEDALKATRGMTFNKIQKGEEAATKARSILTGTGGKKTVIVMYLGGITRTEVAALRYLQQADPSRNIVICTTGIITGDGMIEAALEHRDFTQSD